MGLLSNIGRPSNDIMYEEVLFNNKQYIIGNIECKEKSCKFLIDKDEFSRVSRYSWHVISDNYIATTVLHNKKRKALYLHNLIMNRDAFKGKGQTESIDHINRNGFDNRKENLRLITQTEQNINQVKKKRNVLLPESTNINPDDIPKHIWYVRTNGLHGDRFAIQFKTEGIVWKTTSSKKISLDEKLKHAKEKLEELYEIYPHLNPENSEYESKILLESYNSIISMASKSVDSPTEK
jgi:hypothetical protein